MRPPPLLRIRFSLFFNETTWRSLHRAVDRARFRALSRAGAFVRRRAKSSLRRAPQKTLGEMTGEDRRRYHVREAVARRGGRRRPRRPERSSKPGRPPLLHMRPSPLKRLIFFGYDRARDSVVIGPSRFGRRAGAEALEHGGAVVVGRKRRRVRIKARPFMGPALEAEAPNFPSLFKDSVRPN